MRSGGGRLQTASLSAVFKALHPGSTVFLSGISGESIAFREALARNPEAARDVRFVGVFFPGINRFAYADVQRGARQRAYFMTPELRGPMREGRVELVPADYGGIVKDLCEIDLDVAIVQCSEPDAHGNLSFGICHDFAAVGWRSAKRKVAHINPVMPRVGGCGSIRLDECDIVMEAEGPLVTYAESQPDEVMSQIGRRVAELVRDGDVVQLGVGKVASAVLAALSSHRGLRFRGGMVLEGMLPLVDGGVVRGVGAVVGGAALGSMDFYRRVSEDATFYLAPVTETHDPRINAELAGYITINGAIEVDLFGQINCETVAGRFVGGVGGMPDFVAAARLAPTGRVVFALPATAHSCRRSRIVPRLGSPGLVGAPRYNPDFVVTEYGVARLRGASVDERAEQLVSVAHPAFRDELADRWRALRSEVFE